MCADMLVLVPLYGVRPVTLTQEEIRKTTPDPFITVVYIGPAYTLPYTGSLNFHWPKYVPVV